MATLYVTEQGARVEKEHRRIVVSRKDDVLLAVPAARVDHVVLVGRVGVTTPAMLSLLDENVGLSMLTRTGRLRGRLLPATHKNVLLRGQQFERAKENDFCCRVSRAIVDGKLRNSRTFARRQCRKQSTLDSKPIERISSAQMALAQAKNLDSIRGLEGIGAKAYFSLFREALDGELTFGVRSRRPPKDRVNSLLSLGYSLLTQNLMTACEVVGLDPYIGYLHGHKYGKPALALDLMEEFRAVIVDSTVLNLVNRKKLKRNQFWINSSGGVYLTQEGLKIFFRAYESRLNTTTKHPLVEPKLTYQKIFELQARQLRRVIEGKIESYQPFWFR